MKAIEFFGYAARQSSNRRLFLAISRQQTTEFFSSSQKLSENNRVLIVFC